MKPIWNPLLLALNLVILPVENLIALAENTTPALEQSSDTQTTDTTTPSLVVPVQVVQPVQAPNTPIQDRSASPNLVVPIEAAKPAPTQPATDKPKTSSPQPPAGVKPTPSQAATERSLAESRQQKMIAADQLYMGGQFAAAEKLYREVKAPFAESAPQYPEPILDPAQLSPAGKVYWREAEAAFGQEIKSRVLVPLRLLVEKQPEFIPGHLRLAEALQKHDHPEAALAVLERATALYPQQPDLVEAKVAALAASEQWIEASLAARQFAILNYNQPASAQFTQLADDHLQRYKKRLRSKLRGNAIANVLTGALGYALTGGLLGPFSAIQTTTMVLRGESAVGESVAEKARKQLPMVEDKAVVDYVNEIGQRLAIIAGRNDFKYEFYVVLEDELNAFALPGGKVFINAGAITRTESEAELAGLLAHELSHAVLSHGFQLVAEGNLVANATQFFPYGGTVANLLTLDYSRDMERQADILGTKLLASTGYAADGLHNLMVTLKQQEKSSPPSWLASHPDTKNRVRYLENLIQSNGYNRYAYEGVARHTQIKARVQKLLAEQEQREEKKHQE